MSESKPFDHSYDVVVVGTGAAGLATAMGAADEGLRVVLLENTGKWGGNTAMSGGMWLPNNPLMQRDRAGDSREEALTYLEATVGDEGRATTRARKEAFVDGVYDLINTAEKYGVTFVRAADYPDYYPELSGGKIGRGLRSSRSTSRRSVLGGKRARRSPRCQLRPTTYGSWAEPGRPLPVSSAGRSWSSAPSVAWPQARSSPGSAQDSPVRSPTSSSRSRALSCG